MYRSKIMLKLTGCGRLVINLVLCLRQMVLCLKKMECLGQNDRIKVTMIVLQGKVHELLGYVLD